MKIYALSGFVELQISNVYILSNVDGGRSYSADLRVYAGKIAHFCHSFTQGKLSV